MLRPRNTAAFLNPDPPDVTQEDLACELFVDREDELEDAVERVLSFTQLPHKKVMTVVGLARVGKSHFLQRVFYRVREHFQTPLMVRIPPKAPKVEYVLRDILAQLQLALEECWQADLKSGKMKQGAGDPLRTLTEVRQRLAPAIGGQEATLELTEVVSSTSTIQRQSEIALKAGFKAKLDSLWSKLVPLAPEGSAELGHRGGSQDSRQDGAQSQRKTVIKPFDASQLCDLIALAHLLVATAAHEQGREWRTLLVIDDFDLLTGEDGGYNPWPLLAALHTLVDYPGLFVMTTVREDTYWHEKKSFFELAQIRPFDDNDQLLDVYERHRALFWQQDDPFQDGFVKGAAESAEGRIGVFLQFLNTAFVRNRRRLKGLTLDRYLSSEMDSIRRHLAPDLQGVFDEAIENDSARIRNEAVARLRRSSALQILLDDYSSTDALRLDPIFSSFLRRQRADGHKPGS